MQALIKTLGPQIRNKKVMQILEDFALNEMNELSMRQLAIRAFAGPRDSEDRLLELARNNKIPDDLQMAVAGVLQTAWRQSVREEAAKILRLPAGKAGQLPPVSVLAEKTGDAMHGKEVFNTICSTCHQVGNAGTNFGPALTEIGTKLPKQALYSSILYPDQGISFGYEGYRFKMKDGSEAFGLIVSETSDKVEIKYLATQQTLNKADIVSRVKLNNSLMPANLQSTMSEQDLVDLVEYLSTLKTIAMR